MPVRSAHPAQGSASSTAEARCRTAASSAADYEKDSKPRNKVRGKESPSVTLLALRERPMHRRTLSEGRRSSRGHFSRRTIRSPAALYRRVNPVSMHESLCTALSANDIARRTSAISANTLKKMFTSIVTRFSIIIDISLEKKNNNNS